MTAEGMAQALMKAVLDGVDDVSACCVRLTNVQAAIRIAYDKDLPTEALQREEAIAAVELTVAAHILASVRASQLEAEKEAAQS